MNEHADVEERTRTGRPRWYRDVLLWTVFGVALLLRVAVVLDYESHHPLAERPVIDEASYERWALEIAAGDWLGDRVFFQEPLYPYWIGLIYSIAGPERTVVRMVQAVLGAITCALVMILGRRAFGRVPGAIAGFTLAFYQPHVLMACLLLKPNLFAPLWTLLAILLVGVTDVALLRRWKRRALAIGVLAGLGALLRGNALVLLPVFFAWPLVASRFGWRGAPAMPVRSSLLIAVGALAVLVPTAARNWYVGDVFALTTSGAGTNLYGGNNLDNPFGRAKEFDWVRGIPEYEAGDWESEAERRTGRDLDPGEVSSFWMGEVVASFRRDPWLHLGILWNKARLTLGGYEVPDNHDLAWDRQFVATLRFLPPGFVLFGWLALAGFLLYPLHARRDRGGVALWWYALAYLATIVLTVTSMRARLPLVVVMLPFAGWYVAQWAKPGRRSLELVGAAALAALLAWWPVIDATERADALDKRDFNLATYYASSVDPAEVERARSIAAELDREHPGTPRVQTLIAELDAERAFALRAVGSTRSREESEILLDEALARLRFAVESPATNARERFRANKLAGTIYLRLDEADAAEPCLRAALEFDPRDELVRLALANALYLAALDASAAGRDARALALEAVALLEALRSSARDEERGAYESLLGRVRALLSGKPPEGPRSPNPAPGG